MRRYDGVADGKPKADPGDGGFFIAAGKFGEDRLFLAGRQTPALIPNRYRHKTTQALHAHADLSTGGRVFDGIFQQINQHAFNQHGVAMQQRQCRWKVELDRMLCQCTLDGLDRTADQLFQRVPILTQLQVTGLQARHLQEVVDKLRGAPRLLADGVDLSDIIRLQDRQLHRERVRQPDQRSEWCA